VRLAVDASVLVGEALRLRGRKLLAHPDLDLVIAEEAWHETAHELDRRVGVLIARGRLQEDAAAEFLDAAATVVRAYVTVAPSQLYAERIEEARRRVPRDPRDAPLVALALALDCGIWTADRDFFGCGLPVWTTETLLAQLGVEPDP
jgi:predicted nucleic acid-binding protein